MTYLSAESAELLEKIPYDFSYKFRCPEPTCNTHTMKCTDWEMGQSWRKWRMSTVTAGKSHSGRIQIEMRDQLDTHLYVGTINQHPKEWIIVGLVLSPKVAAKLF